MKGDIRNNIKASRRCLCKKDLSLHRSLNITNHSMSLLVTLYSEVFSQELMPLVFLVFTIWVTDGCSIRNVAVQRTFSSTTVYESQLKHTRNKKEIITIK